MARFALRRLERSFVAEGGDVGESITCMKWAGICLQPSQPCFTDGRSKSHLALMGYVGCVRQSGSVSLGENGTCKAFTSLSAWSGWCSGICSRNKLAGNAGNLEMGIFRSIDDVHMWAVTGLWELPAPDQAVGGKVCERPVAVRWCRAKEDAAQQFCG